MRHAQHTMDTKVSGAAEKLRILAIDDDPAVTDYLSAKLGAHYEVIVTNDATEAVAMARARVPDLILCDVEMPGTDGYEICRKIKADVATRDAPVIFLTVRTDSRDEARGFEAGAVDYIHKRLDREVLEARVRTHLALRDARRAVESQNVQLEVMVARRTAELEASREALREAMHNLRVSRVTTGVYWVQVPEAGLYILCGAPADIVKHLMLRGFIAEVRKDDVEFETGPNVILLSDVLVQNGRFANLAEFPVLQMLYRQGLILPGHPNNTGRKPMLIGSEAQVRAQLDYIYRGNYGLTSEEELRAAGLDAEEARQQMALKLAFAFGEIRPSEELLDYRYVAGEPVDLGKGVSVKRLGLNRYEFSYQGRAAGVNLNLGPEERYEAPYAFGHHQADRQYFGVIHCGEGDGWDLRRQSMGSIVVFQGRYYLVDTGPSILQSLQTLGIDVSEIEGIFHTHAHDDHFAGLPSLIASGHRIKYFTTPLVRHSVSKKFAALMSIDERLFGEFFDVHEIEAGKWNDCDGLEVMPLYSPHPVENNVFLFRALDLDGHKTYAHWADIVSFDVLKKLLDSPSARGVLPADYLETIRARYLTRATLKKIDAGGGLIHGEPADFANDQSAKIVLAHRAAAFSREELSIGSQQSFGAIDVLIPSEQDYVRQQAFRYLSQVFPEAGVGKLNALLRAPVTSFNAGSLILRRGATTDSVYFSLTGSVEQSRADLGASFTLPTGSFIGAYALFNDGPLPDSWRAVSPVRLLQIGVATLREFLHDGGWYERLRGLLEEAAFLQSTWLFGERVPYIMQSRLARAGGSMRLGTGSELPRTDSGSLYMVRTGRIELVHEHGHVFEALGPGDFAGEESCLKRAAPPWRCVAREDTEVLSLAASELGMIPIVLWKLLETHERRLRSTEFMV